MIEVYGTSIPGDEPVSAFPDSLRVLELAARLGVTVDFVVMMAALHSLSVTAEAVVIQPQAERIARIIAEAGR